MASLVTTDGTSFELAESETLVGRGERDVNDPPKIDVGPLPGGATVSRQHVRIFRRADVWYLRVESSARNPTLLGGRRIPGGEEMQLADDTRVQIGDVALIFKAPQSAPSFSPDSTMADGMGDAAAPEPSPAPVAAPPIATPVQAPAPAVAQVVKTGPAAAPAADWPARLGGRPATLTALGVAEFKRVNPFRGLMIDEGAWADAHDYHRIQTRLHLLSAHGWGIVEGLEVVADAHLPNTLVIRPGVAVDAQGRALIVPQERRLPVSAEQGPTMYVAVRLHEEFTQPQRFWNDVDEYTRVVERCEVLVQRTPFAAPALELARVAIAGAVRNAPDLLDPQPGEIDLRFRERLIVRPRPELAIAQLVLADGDRDGATSAHRLGLRYLLREIGLSTAYRARWTGVFRLEDPLPPVSLLYLGGSSRFTIADEVVGRLREFFAAGGVLFADACQDGKGAEFAAGVEALAGKLGSSLQPVGRWHPILTARHLFAEAPLATKGAALSEGGGLVLSTLDYGCAWQGGPKDRPLARDVIRAALELGVNVAVYARQRQRPLEVVDLEA